MLLRIMQKSLSETAEDCLLSSQNMESNVLKHLQSHCANMTFADKSRYDRTFQQVTHKGG